MHFLLTVKDGDLETILLRAKKASIYIEPLRTYATEATEAKFVIGFDGIDIKRLKSHMDVLLNVLLGLK